jgi:hypothetical protein
MAFFILIEVIVLKSWTDASSGSLDVSYLPVTGPSPCEVSMAACAVYGNRLYGITRAFMIGLTIAVFGGQSVEPKVIDRGLRILTLRGT